jgi:alpha-beta hydrolase superfamily lysophospholipase
VVVSREFNYDGVSGRRAARSWSDPQVDPTHVVLLAHGYGEHIGRYQHVAEALFANGAAVYGVDHVGHGRSEGERVLLLDLEEVVLDVHQLDEIARAEHPDLPVALIGHSMGGLIGARYLQRYGKTLATAVLSGPVIGEFTVAHALLALDEMPDEPLDVAVLSRDDAVGRAYSDDPLVWHGPFKRPTVEAMARGAEAVQRGPSVGRLPLLWIHGVDDALVPLENSRSGIEHLKGDVFEQRLYEGARHEVFNETNNAEVLADVTDFLNRTLATAPARG